MKIDPVSNLSPSIIRRLRYLEWLFIAVHVMLAIAGNYDRLSFKLAVYAMFAIFSWIMPINRSLGLRKAYLLLAMLLIVSASFLNVSLDLLVYLYIAKSFFLLGSRRTRYITIVTGIGWIISECYSEIQELQQQYSVTFEPPFGFGNYNLKTILIFSTGIYVAVSIFTIFFSSVIVSEYKSRKRAEALAEQVEILAADLERTRIARDIHDSLGHTLTNLDIQLAVAQKLRDRDPPKAFQAIDTAKMLSSQCIEDVSHSIQTMRSSDFDLNCALSHLLEQIKSDRTVKIHWEINLPQLPITTSHQIYCIVKEGLINIQKHARATYISFESKISDREIILQLNDNGIGFDTTASISGFGLRGMRERVQSLGGTLKIDSSPDRGTQILAIIPR